MAGDDFTLPTTASTYYVTSIRLWVSGYDDTAFSDMFNSISLYMAPGGPNASAAPIQYVSTVTSATAATYPNGQGYLSASGSGGYPDPIPADWYDSIWQLDFPVNATFAGGTQINFGILADGKLEPTPGLQAGVENYYLPFLTLSNPNGGLPMYSGGSPTFVGADNASSEFGIDGTWTDSIPASMDWGDANVQVFGVVPEPSTFVLLAAGLAGLLAFAWRKR